MEIAKHAARGLLTKKSMEFSKKSSAIEMNLCYDELNTYIDTFDKKVSGYLSEKETSYMNMYTKLLENKSNEIKEIEKKIDNTMGETAERLQNRKIKEYLMEKEILANKLESLSSSYDTLEKEYRKLNIQIERSRDDNKFLKQKLETRMEENTNLRLMIKSTVINIQDYENTINNTTDALKKIAKYTEILDMVKTTFKPIITGNASFESVLESYIEPISKPPQIKNDYVRIPSMQKQKRCNSVIREAPRRNYNPYIKNLNKKNESLERQINALKSKMGSSIYQRQYLEEIFVNCINATKKEIMKKKMKTGSNQIPLKDKKVKFTLSGVIRSTVIKIKESFEENSCLKISDLSKDDKINLVTLFVCNEKVLKCIYNILFPRYENTIMDEKIKEDFIYGITKCKPQNEFFNIQNLGNSQSFGLKKSDL